MNSMATFFNWTLFRPILFVLLAATITFELLRLHQSGTLYSTKADYHNSAYHDVKEPVPNYVFVTLLAGPSVDSEDQDISHDNYFVATRLLGYQLMHAPQTKSQFPFVVVVSGNVSIAKQERLRRDGATVVEVEGIHSDWAIAPNPTYRDIYTKLRIWEMTQYDLICFVDSDHVLTGPLDGVFDDPATTEQTTRNLTDAEAYKPDEGPLPATYVFASQYELHVDHDFPPRPDDHWQDFWDKDYHNGGFLVLRPDKTLFDHYMAILSIEDRFTPGLAEQNLLNYAHRWWGNMPWKPVDPKWNAHYPTQKDLDNRVVSLHDKFWAPTHPELKDYEMAWKHRMDGFYEARDLLGF